MTAILTDNERATLNAALEIIKANTPAKATWMPGFRRSEDGHFNFDLTYFTSRNDQNSWLRGKTFADKVEEALQIQRREDSDESGARARQIESLKAELARLTGEAA